MHRFILTVLSIFFLNSVLAFGSYIDTDAKTAVVIDATTGKVLFEKNKDEKTFPASMTKIMTTLIVFDKERITLNEPVYVPKLVSMPHKANIKRGCTPNSLYILNSKSFMSIF